jgi:hypothetical protein
LHCDTPWYDQLFAFLRTSRIRLRTRASPNKSTRIEEKSHKQAGQGGITRKRTRDTSVNVSAFDALELFSDEDACAFVSNPDGSDFVSTSVTMGADRLDGTKIMLATPTGVVGIDIAIGTGFLLERVFKQSSTSWTNYKYKFLPFAVRAAANSQTRCHEIYM